jgi:hypothetical protein
MSHASGNALGEAISPVDVSFVQQHGHNQVVEMDNVARP